MLAIFPAPSQMENFEWAEECVIAFEESKQLMLHPSVLSQPKWEEVLYAYIAVIDHAVSLVLVRTEN